MLISEGAYIRRGLSREGNLHNIFKIDWASLIVKRKSTGFALFVFEGNFQVQAAGGRAYIWRVFCVMSLGDIYLEGLIFGILR